MVMVKRYDQQFVELIVNEVTTTCMVKKQHMQWSQKAGLLLANSHGYTSMVIWQVTFNNGIQN